MSSLPYSLIANAFDNHPQIKHSGFVYGTAGFRMDAGLLDSVVFSVGILASLRESYATKLANASNREEFVAIIRSIVDSLNIDISISPVVIVGRDTRTSGQSLVSTLQDAVLSIGGRINDFGIVTTPQLHYLVRALNSQNQPDCYGEATLKGYYNKLSSAFKSLIADSKPNDTIHVDTANGVGFPALQSLAQTIGSSFSVVYHNNDIATPELLNDMCGADFVKLKQAAPKGIDMEPLTRYASFDGDADRIVFYYKTPNNTFKLLDGDKIATLACSFIQETLKQADITHLNVGLVQTAYANGNSTHYVKDVLNVPVVFTCTGVKYLHHQAEKFDIGIYFEANGHGTVLFNEKAIQAFQNTNDKSPHQSKACHRLYLLSELINQTVGDALSDLLLVEYILSIQCISFSDWDSAYTDLPSKQEKVKVHNKNLFVPINADTELEAPLSLQHQINDILKRFVKARCFVRPSGTEDIVRVYVEALTKEETDLLSAVVCGIVFDSFGGCGPRPEHYKTISSL